METLTPGCILSGINSTSPNGCPIEQYKWSINGEDYLQEGVNAHLFDVLALGLNTGNYQVCLSVKDCAGWSDPTCINISI